ncbi:organic cation transporter protein-like isoform X2 [Anticarsia gemmatalis]
MSTATECTEWVYDKPDSFVAEFDLGCEDWKRTLVGTSHSIGYMIGLPFLGTLSDKYGRKKLIIITSIAGATIGIWKSLVSSYWLYLALEMLEPMIGDGCSTIFITAMEMITKEQRPIMMVFKTSVTIVTYILMAVLAYLVQNWRSFLLYLYIPPLIIIFYMFWMDESLRWLLSKGKKEEAKKIILEAAKLNKITIDEKKLANLKCEENITTASFGSTIKLTVSSKKLMLRTLICFCIWFTSLFNDYSLIINSVSLHGNKYINFGLMGVSRIFTAIVMFYVLTKLQRKAPLILAMTLTGVLCISQAFVSKDYPLLSTLLYMSGRASASFCVSITYLYTTELFPTYTRNTILALCSSVGRTAIIMAPQTPLLLKYWTGLPSLIIGILSLMTASVVTLMPDTSDTVLPNNVEQAEAVGKKKTKDMSSAF